jgi:hypothetical protein
MSLLLFKSILLTSFYTKEYFNKDLLIMIHTPPQLFQLCLFAPELFFIIPFEILQQQGVDIYYNNCIYICNKKVNITGSVF